MQTKIISKINLLFQEGSSDKQYDVIIEDSGDGTYAVNAFWGRRGGNLNIAPQGQGFSLEKAKTVFNSTVNKKVTKGYKIDENTDKNIIVGIKEITDTGLRAQLLNPISIKEADFYLTDNTWGLQEKFDGERLLVKKTKESIIFSNRNGKSTIIPGSLQKSLENIDNTYIMDGENVNGTFYVFDLLERQDEDLRETQTVEERNESLRILNELQNDSKNIIFVQLVTGTEKKRLKFNELKENNKEGVVFKKLTSKWTAGRPASGGNQIKCKFWESASCIVLNHNDKQSFNVGLYDENNIMINMGNVKSKGEKPPIGSVCEIKYLYVIAKGGSLYQPDFIAERHDILPEECLMSQIKYKG